MALNIPTYPNPFNQTQPLVNAYAWLAGLALDLSNNTGRMTLNIHPDEQAWISPPISQISIRLGDVLSSDPIVRFPTLQDLMADADFAAAYAVVGQKLYEAALAHPLLKDSTPIT